MLLFSFWFGFVVGVRFCPATKVGNAVTDTGSDKEGIINFYWSHALISDETYEGLVRSCRSGSGHEALASEACQKWFDKAYREVGNIDLHTIYTPICLTPDPYQPSQTNTAPKHWNPVSRSTHFMSLGFRV